MAKHDMAELCQFGTAGFKAFLVASAAVGALMTGASAADDFETVVVTGYRASLEKSLDLKRNTSELMEAIYAEDVAKFPDANLAEALQRLPGVAVDRENGEGRSITVRGLNSSFTRVTLNGLETLATAGGTQGAQSSPNRERGFDFNTFASELFGSLKVKKSASASSTEGSLGATVELSTPHPFEQGGGERYLLGLQNAWYEVGKPFNPRITGLASKTFMGGRLGFLVSAAYSSKGTSSDSYSRSSGTPDLIYRNSGFATLAPVAGFDNGSQVVRMGFAAPTGSSCDGTTAPYTNGVIPGNNITYMPYCYALSGSNPSAYATVNSPIGWTLSDTNTTVGKTASAITSPAGQVLIPALPSLTHQQIYASKLGFTVSAQWQPDDDTLVTVDGLLSTSYQDTNNLVLSPIGLNRNSTNTALNAVGASTTDTTLRGFYYNCTAAPENNATTGLLQAPVDCGGTTLVSGTSYSYNPNNLDIYDYYTSAYSAAHYVPGASRDKMLSNAIALLGRPSTKVLDAKVNGNVASYLKLDNLDWASRADQVFYSTQFEQLSTNIKRNFGQKLRVEANLGWSRSYNHQMGYTVEVNSLDVHAGSYYPGDVPNASGYFIYDATNGGGMPSMSLGFNANDPNMWSFVKGFSALRVYQYLTKNAYRSATVDVAYDITDHLTLKAGFMARIYDFDTDYASRAMRDVVNPAFEELGVTTAEMTQQVTWGRGLSVGDGAVTSWIGPNLQKFKDVTGLACNCVNKYGDWRIWDRVNSVSSGAATGTYVVHEHSKSYYLQTDFSDIFLFGNPLRGNVGTRFVVTEVSSTGHSTSGQPVSDHYSYSDFLPSANLVYSLTDDMVVRGAASLNMARASLAQMAPSITAFSPPTANSLDIASQIGSMTIGNTHLKPYRAKSLDLGWEWYFDKGSLLAITGFVKWIKDNPQQVVTNGPLNNFITGQTLDTLKSQYASLCASQGGKIGDSINSNCNALWYITNNVSMNATQPLNGKGGVMQGIEITYQQPLTFIPAVFGGKGLGMTANYTHIESKQHIITNATLTSVTVKDAPWIGTSPDAGNLTVYYDGNGWSGRMSAAWRSAYIYSFPISGGTALIGYDNNPAITDFNKSRPTLTVDAKATYEISENIEASIDALNLTNQLDRRFAYMNNPITTSYGSSGRAVFMGFRMKY